MDAKINYYAGKKGQITMFILIGIIIVVAIVLMFLFYKNRMIEPLINIESYPEKNIGECFIEVVEGATEKVLEANGYLHSTPEVNLSYMNITVPYLCYTDINYDRCKVNEPFFIRHIEGEIKKEAEDGIEKCFNDLKRDISSKGYEINIENTENYSLALLPNEINVIVKKKVVIKKEGVYDEFEAFETKIKSPVYEMALISQEITNQESKFCNSEYVEMLRQYKDFKIRKVQLGNDPKV
jgi:hypothetical protein